MRGRTFRAALAVAAVALVVAGCGSSPKNSGTGPIDVKAFDGSPCDVYRDKGLLALIKPELGPHGVHISFRNLARGFSDDGVVIVADSCILADAAAAGVSAILRKPDSLRAALAYLQGLRGIHGAMLMRGDRIGVAGGLELAA